MNVLRLSVIWKAVSIMSSWVASNEFLGVEDMRNNALLVYSFFRTLETPWTLNAIAALLANMQKESSINPGIWEDLTPDPTHQSGYGLVQWTPASKYIDWAGSNWAGNGTKQCERLEYERENGMQWIPTERYPISFTEFTQSEANPEALAYVWMYNYERPASLDQPERQTYAKYWHDFLQGKEPEPVPPSARGKIPVWMLKRLRDRSFN